MKLNFFKSSDDPKDMLCIRDRTFYACGNVGLCIPYSMIAFFMMFYYTDYIGLSSAVVGTILMACKILDGVSDILMGYIIDKTHTRWGKARPWIIFPAPFYAIAFVLLFAVPLDWTVKMQYVWVAITYILLNPILYTMVGIALFALNSLMTSNQEEHGMCGVFMQTGATLIMLLINFVTLKAVKAAGNTAESWTKVVIVYAIIMLITYIICFFGTKERVDTSRDEELARQQQQIPLKDRVKALAHNKYWLMFTAVYTFFYIDLALNSGFAVYYAKVILGSEDHQPLLSNAVTFVALVVLVVVGAPLMKKIGKGKVYMLAGICGALGCLLQLFGGSVLAIVAIGAGVRGLCQGFVQTTQNGIMADTIDYGRISTGIDISGIGSATSSFATKVGNGVAAGAVGWLLAAGNYDGTLPVQPTSANIMIRVGYIIIPLILDALIIFVMSRYDLDKKMKEMANAEASEV